MANFKTFTIVATRGTDTQAKHDLSACLAESWLDEYKEYGWSTVTTESGTERRMSYAEIAAQ